MGKTFSKNERKIADALSLGTTFTFKGEQFTVTKVGKPQVTRGECKTDIYVEAKKNSSSEIIELKISYKQSNADFIENKMTDERAAAILGSNWKNIIESATRTLQTNFENRPIILKTGRFAGSITLGWKYELLDVKSGVLSSKLSLSEEQVKNVYSGDNLSVDKRDAEVDGLKIKDSGVANYMLRTDMLDDAQSIIDSLQTIDEYVEEHPDVYFACKALNYRTFAEKYDGDRPLAVQIDWENENGMLVPRFNYSQPLVRRGNEIASNLLKVLSSLGIETTDDIDSSNFSESELIKE